MLKTTATSHSNKPTHYWMIVLGMLLVLPGLWVGLQVDDYFHWSLVQKNADVLLLESPASFYGLFSFLDGSPARVMEFMNLGMLPWWTYPEIQFSFWRPLTELTHGLDYTLFEHMPVFMHMHSLLYMGLLLWFASIFYQRIQGEATAVFWASLLFALSYSHGLPAGWLANRNAVLAVLFLVLTLMFHHQYRQSKNGVNGVVALLCFSAGLLSGEMAVSTGAYLFAYAICIDTNRWGQRFLSLLPYGVIGVVWLGLRKWFHYGASGSGHYIDPLQTPWLFLQTLYVRGSDLLAGLWWVWPPELANALPASRAIVFLLLCLLLLVVSLPMLRANREARFWLLGALLCLVPVSSTLPHSRLLIAASVGASGFLGLLIAYWRTRRLSQHWVGRRVTAVTMGLIVFLHVGLSAMLLPIEAYSMRLAGDALINDGALSLSLPDIDDDTTVIVINPPLSSAAGYINGVRLYRGMPVAEKTWMLASGTHQLTLRVQDSHAIDLESEYGLYDQLQEGLLRGAQVPMQINDQVQLSGVVVTVLAVDKGVPTKARFHFSEPLNSQHYRFFHWNGGDVSACQLPESGKTITLNIDSADC